MQDGRRHDQDEVIEARQTAARRFGFLLGCIAAVIAAVIQLIRVRHVLTWSTVVIYVCMAALNIPLGILFALIGERVSRTPPAD